MTLSNQTKSISGELEAVRRLIHEELHSGLPEVDGLLQELSGYEGKMLRPMLVLLSGQMAGRLTGNHILLAAAAEMIHQATLLHDDVLDEADSRRGRPSINVLHGNEVSVLLGDLLLSRAFDLCVRIEIPGLLSQIARTTRIICEGEIAQVCRRGQYDLMEEDYVRIIAGKTASLMSCCCQLGAQLAGALPPTIEACEEFGSRLGIAFQIMDDVRDLDHGGGNTTGKTLGTDMLKEKMTLPLIHYLAAGDQARRLTVQTILRSQDHSRRQELAGLLVNSGSVEYARRRAADYIQQAKIRLADFSQAQPLYDLADFVLS